MLDAEWDFISAALPRLLTGDNDRLQTVCDQLYQFSISQADGMTGCGSHEQAEARALAANNKERAGWQAYRAGYTYYLRNQPAEVLACAARAAEHWQDSTPSQQSDCHPTARAWIQTTKRLPRRYHRLPRSVEIYRSISPESDDVAIALNDLAGAESINKDYPAAERDYREALRIAR